MLVFIFDERLFDDLRRLYVAEQLPIADIFLQPQFLTALLCDEVAQELLLRAVALDLLASHTSTSWGSTSSVHSLEDTIAFTFLPWPSLPK